MKPTIASLTILTLAAGLFPATAADIRGKVTLKGTPPPEIVIQFDAVCGKMHNTPVTTRHYLVSKDGGLANVFVYVKEGARPTPPPPNAETPMLDQINCLFEPYVMGVQTGQKFKVLNSDSLLHNVHATPKINKEFNLGQPVKGMVVEKSFDKPEVLVRFKCDVHPWMFAYVGVLDHPYFSVTDKDGNFKITGLPAGKYTLEAVHLKAGTATHTLDAGADDKNSADFVLEVKSRPAP